MSSPLLEFSYSERAIAGSRPYQEDTSKVWRPNGSVKRDRPLLAVLADGMGGHVSGEIASRLAVEQYIRAFSSEKGSVDQRLEHSLHAGNDAILNAIRKENGLDGMGCTLVASYIDQDGLRWASVGDSMLLLFRDHTLIRKNESHSLGALLDLHAEAKVISEDEAKNSPRRHTLRSALTGAPIPLKQIEPQAHPLQSGDWIIMASDGLETLSGDAIAQIINEHKDDSPDAVAQSLIKRVEAEGLANQDNTTVIVIRVQDPSLLPTRIVGSGVPQAALERVLNNGPAAVATAPAPPAPRKRPILAALVAGVVGGLIALLIAERTGVWKGSPGPFDSSADTSKQQKKSEPASGGESASSSTNADRRNNADRGGRAATHGSSDSARDDKRPARAGSTHDADAAKPVQGAGHRGKEKDRTPEAADAAKTETQQQPAAASTGAPPAAKTPEAPAKPTDNKTAPASSNAAGAGAPAQPAGGPAKTNQN